MAQMEGFNAHKQMCAAKKNITIWHGIILPQTPLQSWDITTLEAKLFTRSHTLGRLASDHSTRKLRRGINQRTPAEL